MNQQNDVDLQETQWAKITDRMLRNLDEEYRPLRFADVPAVDPSGKPLKEGESHLSLQPIRVWNVDEQEAEIRFWISNLN